MPKISREEHLVGALYDGLLSRQAWHQALTLLAGEIGASQCGFMIWNDLDGRFEVNDQEGMHPDFLRDFLNDFQLLDPTPAAAHHLPAGEIYVDQRHLGANEIKRSPFYQEFLGKHGVGSVLCAILARETGRHSLVSFQRTSDRGGFDAEQEQLIHHLMPHLQRVAKLRLQLDKVESSLALGNQVLNALGFPVLVLDFSRNLIMANSAGHHWLAQPDCPLAGKRAPDIQTNVRALLDRASGVHAVARSTGFYLPATATSAGEYLLALPLREPNRHVADGPGNVMLLIQRAGWSPLPARQVLSDLFRLTAAELRLLEALARVHQLPAAADQLGVSVETARSQLKSVFSKTGTRNQSELAALIMQLRLGGSTADGEAWLSTSLSQALA